MTIRSAFVVLEDSTLAVYQSEGDIQDYAIDLTEYLTGGDALETSTWTATGAVTITAPAQAGAVVSAFIAGTQGSVTHTATTALGRRKVRSFCVLPEPVSSCGV